MAQRATLNPSLPASQADSLLSEPSGKPQSESESSLSHVHFFATAWTIQSMEFSRPEYWSE